ncbi:MAG: DNA gyrase subunit A, partial [Planctomycetaceae bacterium]|nr:DNA gyrase subunit A [Planctomycetaceae bacterium]
DIKTTKRNGKVIDILAVQDDDEVLMVTGLGKIQRVRAADIREVGRNTQGVRIIRLDEEDKLVSIARIPAEVVDESEPPAPVPDDTENGEAPKAESESTEPETETPELNTEESPQSSTGETSQE